MKDAYLQGYLAGYMNKEAGDMFQQKSKLDSMYNKAKTFKNRPKPKKKPVPQVRYNQGTPRIPKYSTQQTEDMVTKRYNPDTYKKWWGDKKGTVDGKIEGSYVEQLKKNGQYTPTDVSNQTYKTSPEYKKYYDTNVATWQQKGQDAWKKLQVNYRAKLAKQYEDVKEFNPSKKPYQPYNTVGQ
jgi:hypothetical protein